MSVALQIDNLTASPVVLTDLGVTISASGSLSLPGGLATLMVLADEQVQDAVDAGTIRVTDGVNTTLPIALLSWKTARYTSDSIINISNAGGATLTDALDSVVAQSGGPLFEYTAAMSVTTSESFITKLSMIDIPQGTYLVRYGYGWAHDSVSSDFEGRLLLNGVQSGELHKQEPKDATGGSAPGTTQRMYLQRESVIVLPNLLNTLDVQYRTDNSNDSSSIWETTIVARKVS